jgi:hypothetical protein
MSGGTKTAKDYIAKNRIVAKTHDIKFEGGIITIRALSDSGEVTFLEKKARAFYKQCTERPLSDWKPFLPISESGARMACYLQQLAVDPPFTVAESLEFAKDCSAAMVAIFAGIMDVISAGVAEDETEAYEAEKNA